MTRREFSKRQRAEIVLRATDPDTGVVVCEGCGLRLGGKPFEIDHRIPEALVVDKSRPLTAEDGQLLGRDCCHRAPGGKTAEDVARIAKARRQHLKHTGAWPKSKVRIPSRPFASTRG
jgi:hypothetical protein